MECEIRLETEKPEQDICLEPEAYNQASGGTIEITENGTYDVTKYQEAEVDVPVDASAAFNTVVDFEAAGVTNSVNWYKQALVKGEVLPLMTFTIADSVANVNSLFSNASIARVRLSGGKNVGEMTSTMFQCKRLVEFSIADQALSGVTNLMQLLSHCSALTTVDLSNWRPDKVTILTYALSFYSSLESANLGGWNTEELQRTNSLFYQDSALKMINISGWTSEAIEATNDMLYGCLALEALVIDSPSVFRITGVNAIANSGIARGTGFVYVPDNLVDEYKSATNWSTVADQIKPLSELPQEVKDVFHMA